jgi:type I restriction enzyme S subunit
MNNVQWEKVRFDQFFDMLPTNTLSRDKLNSQRGEYQNIHYGDVLIKYPYCLDCNNNEIPYINDGVKFNTAEVKDGDVIFADTAEDDTVGKCVEVLNVGDRKIVSGLHTYFCRPKYKLAPGYLGYFLNSNHFHNQLLPYIAGSKVSSVNRTSIARTYISYPADLPVQRRIAAILSSADKVIDSTQKTIAKYKQMKQGMMEELFNEQCTMNNVQWKKMRLGDIGKISMCKRVFSFETSTEGEIPFYKIGTFGKTADAFISRQLYEEYKSKFSYPKVGDILISASGTIGRTVVYDGEPAYFQDSNIIWIDNDEQIVLNQFLYYLYQTITWNLEGSTIARLYNDNFNKIEISVPALTEQRRIASILSSIDAKIAAEEKALEKYEKVKKGLMEILLNEK